MSIDESGFGVARILGSLHLNPSEFGYRAQALFAESLVRLNASIRTIARVGHPDILAQVGDHLIRFQIKATGQSSFSLSREDLDGIRPQFSDEKGYLAVLDLGPPALWCCVPHARAEVLVGRNVPIAMLKAMSDEDLSSQCNESFVGLVMENQASIAAFTFNLVRRRALNSELQ